MTLNNIDNFYVNNRNLAPTTMKNPIIILSVLISFLLIISACKKTEEISAGPSCLLTMITYGEYEYDGNIADLSYDENNRLIRRTWNGNPDSDYYTYQYNSDGKLILTTSFLDGVVPYPGWGIGVLFAPWNYCLPLHPGLALNVKFRHFLNRAE